MSELHMLDAQRTLDLDWTAVDLPDLSRLDRLSLRIGLALILRTHRLAERSARAEEARKVAGPRETAARVTFERRVDAGPVW